MRKLALIAVVAAVAAAGCGGQKSATNTPPATPSSSVTPTVEPDMKTTASGLKYKDLKVGKGPIPQPGDECVVHYTGWLTSGHQFDSSRGKPAFSFPLGQGRVIAGWDEGLSTMRVGGSRKLVVPPDLAYGDGGNQGIPPNSTLIFEVELLAIR